MAACGDKYLCVRLDEFQEPRLLLGVLLIVHWPQSHRHLILQPLPRHLHACKSNHLGLKQDNDVGSVAVVGKHVCGRGERLQVLAKLFGVHLYHVVRYEVYC